LTIPRCSSADGAGGMTFDIYITEVVTPYRFCIGGQKGSCESASSGLGELRYDREDLGQYIGLTHLR